MSLWTSIRDLGESAAVLAGNYLLPGSAAITSNLTSQGSQEQLRSPFGQLAQLGSGGYGGYEGNLSNYGSIFGGSSGGAAAGMGGAQGLSFDGAGSGLSGAGMDGTGAGLTAGGYGGGYDLFGAGASTGAGLGGAGMDATGAGLTGGFGAGSSFSDLTRQRMGGYGSGGYGGSMFGGGGGSGLLKGIGALQLAGGLQQYQAQSQRQAQQQGYAQQMQQLIANPSQVESLPGYQAGLRAVQRKGRAEGFGGSGSMAAALAGYGGQQYQQQLSNLAALQGGSQPVGSPMMGLVGAGLGAYNMFG
jgi:hypothetical protein